MTQQPPGRTVAAVWADLNSSPMGLPSKLNEPLDGETVLRRTVRRLLRSEKLDDVVVYCPPPQAERIQAMLDGLSARLLPLEAPAPPHWPMIQAARKPALSAWRGGLSGACAFDEEINAPALARLAEQFNAQAIAVAPAAAALIDPQIVDNMVELHWQHHRRYKLTFCQAPPGLAPAVLRADLIRDIASGPAIVGSALAYRPDDPKIDPISNECNLRLEQDLILCPYRFIADSARSLQILQRFNEQVGQTDGADITQVTRWANERAADITSRWPTVVELELTCQSKRSGTLRPRIDGPRRSVAADIDLLLQRLAEVARQVDDLFVIVGGFGEPLLHPQWRQILTGLKAAGVFGLCLQTDGLLIDPQAAETLVQSGLDVVLVQLDAPQQQLYRQLCGCDAYRQAVDGIENLLNARQKLKSFVPLVVPEMIKTPQTLEVMESFYDYWVQRLGWAVIRGYSDRAGQLPDRSTGSLAPPKRLPCRRIFKSMLILADGTVTACEEDFLAKTPMGNIAQQPILDIWQGPQFRALRQAHTGQELTNYPLCQACRQWHRP